MDEILARMVESVQSAARERRALCIRSGGTKDFYGNTPRGNLFDPRAWTGIENHEPSELVITVRAGTPLREVELALGAKHQMLAFEPPHFGSTATIGGCIAAGLAGPRRSSAGFTYGGVREAVLGARLLDGRGRLMHFGGTVIKNVAGYDVSRVLAGSLGVLGVIIDLSLKVLPCPENEVTLLFEMSEIRALEQLNMLGGQPVPLSASCWRDDRLWLRLSGSAAAVESAARMQGGERVEKSRAAAFWQGLREQNDGWFGAAPPLWRISVPSVAEPLSLAGEQSIEWGGALRWLRTDLPLAVVRARAQALGGHATLFRGGDRKEGVFTPLTASIAAIHRRLKDEFDPAGIFNPGRMYAEL
jgi:glycolate oxidase FAD binding subunit